MAKRVLRRPVGENPYGPKWDDTFYVRAANLARKGMSNEGIAGALGVSKMVFYRWLKKRPALADALQTARAEGTTEDFLDYVHERLPPDLHEVWEEIMDLTPAGGKPSNIASQRIAGMVNKLGKRVQQRLFVYALVGNDWCAAAALSILHIPYRRYLKWMSEDPAFKEMLGFVGQCRKDFCESALMALVREGNVAAIMFVNRTINRDRGYAENVRVEAKVEHKHEHEHTLKLEDLNLPPDALDKILTAARGRSAGALPAPIDAEFSNTEVTNDTTTPSAA